MQTVVKLSPRYGRAPVKKAIIRTKQGTIEYRESEEDLREIYCKSQGGPQIGHTQIIKIKIQPKSRRI